MGRLFVFIYTLVLIGMFFPRYFFLVYSNIYNTLIILMSSKYSKIVKCAIGNDLEIRREAHDGK
jgi:hypothetical protein